MTTFAVNQTATSTALVQSIPSSSPVDEGELLYYVGSYACSPSLDMPLLISFFDDFLKKTDNTLQAVLTYAVFNLHAANSLDSPSGPAQSPVPNTMPSPPNSIGAMFHANLSSYIFTPNLLHTERANINSSWLTVANASQPDPSYYSSEVSAGSTVSSPNGWPSESFLQFENTWRLVLGIENIDPQLTSYNYDEDQDVIFPKGVLSQYPSSATISINEGISKCFFDPNNASLAAANSSWAVNVISLDAQSLTVNSSTSLSAQNSISSDTACGISAILNSTLGDITADLDIKPYQGFLYDTVWSWAYGEPKDDAEAPSDGGDKPSSDFRCAALNGTDSRWRVTRCQNLYYGACRTHGLPYSWQLTAGQDTYANANQNCPPNASFAVPRTALENHHLLKTVQRIKIPMVWVDLNSMDVEHCWVSGANSSCPYEPIPSHSGSAIIVPTVAAIVIIVLALLTVLIKCGSNRAKSKKRRRVYDGWDYEGVPS